MRNNAWLSEKMYELWENNFVDVARLNRVVISFGRKSVRQLGCIKWASAETRGLKKILAETPKEAYEDPRISMIIVTGYFKNPEIPDYVVEGTIAHEMCHYFHGFNSPLQQLFDHPHKGGVIRKEMQKRGLGDTYKQANLWLKQNWHRHLKSIRGAR
ncbi:MAG: hypothetical protein QY330_04665 [Candidatus Dojkabacteria bacterium]|uniref:SprT-like family protein n=2 Tax=Candidatus Dojkabacteria TaxID=74243 RepID=A0A136KGU6_9BACT|nr:MAG: hypothetical protein UZ20_WS6002000772 [candidate division WS6 bacterium OLB21]MBW7954126.1 hypothetical protein [Candidatus Dojkabacteria bacterium]WKZ27810.1 MAG: hypothetical protein QY330_04665 [Candidatus Dojkabacteria bacterium]